MKHSYDSEFYLFLIHLRQAQKVKIGETLIIRKFYNWRERLVALCVRVQ